MNALEKWSIHQMIFKFWEFQLLMLDQQQLEPGFYFTIYLFRNIQEYNVVHSLNGFKAIMRILGLFDKSYENIGDTILDSKHWFWVETN